jgi:hypothetical protein
VRSAISVQVGETPALFKGDIAKLITFLSFHLVGQQSSQLQSYWKRVNSCADLELLELGSLLSEIFGLVLKGSGCPSNEAPLIAIKRLCEIQLANPDGPEDTMWQLASDLIDDLGELPTSVPSRGSCGFIDVVWTLVHSFESLHLAGEWSPSTAWKNVEESARIEERGRANWGNIGDFIVTFCGNLLKAVEISDVAGCACHCLS